MIKVSGAGGDSGLGEFDTEFRRLWDCVSDCSHHIFRRYGDGYSYGEKTPAEINLFAWQIISLLAHRADYDCGGL